MRVAIVTESFLPTVNGVTTSVCRVVECLAERGHTVTVVAPGPGPAEYSGARVHSLHRVTIREFPLGLPTAALATALDGFEPDVVHVASPFVVGARALTLTQGRGTPSVAIYQTDMPSYLQLHGPRAVGRGASRAAWRWVRRTHAKATLTLAPSRATLEELRAHGIPRTRLWGRGVDTALFHPGRRVDPRTVALRRSLAPGGEVLLGYVGRLAPEKELHRLAELAAVPGTRLVLVGDGPSRHDLDATLGAATSAGRVCLPPVFLGRLEGEELARAYAALDVFVHTGTRETFGQTLQEAAATGLPVLAPARGGPLDLVRPGRTGWLFDPDRPGSLAAHAIRLATDPHERTRMGAAGRAGLDGRSWPRLTDELVSHYETAMGVGPALAC